MLSHSRFWSKKLPHSSLPRCGTRLPAGFGRIYVLTQSHSRGQQHLQHHPPTIRPFHMYTTPSLFLPPPPPPYADHSSTSAEPPHAGTGIQLGNQNRNARPWTCLGSLGVLISYAYYPRYRHRCHGYDRPKLGSLGSSGAWSSELWRTRGDIEVGVRVGEVHAEVELVMRMCRYRVFFALAAAITNNNNLPAPPPPIPPPNITPKHISKTCPSETSASNLCHLCHLPQLSAKAHSGDMRILAPPERSLSPPRRSGSKSGPKSRCVGGGIGVGRSASSYCSRFCPTGDGRFDIDDGGVGGVDADSCWQG